MRIGYEFQAHSGTILAERKLPPLFRNDSKWRNKTQLMKHFKWEKHTRKLVTSEPRNREGRWGTASIGATSYGWPASGRADGSTGHCTGRVPQIVYFERHPGFASGSKKKKIEIVYFSVKISHSGVENFASPNFRKTIQEKKETASFIGIYMNETKKATERKLGSIGMRKMDVISLI